MAALNDLRRAARLLVLLWLLVMPAACGMTTAPAQPDTAEPDVSMPVIVLERSGGITGVTESWSIYADGTVRTRDGRTRSVPPEDVSRLLDEIEADGFFDLQASYAPEDACCDQYTYTLTVRRGDKSHQTMTTDNATDAPPVLEDAVTAVLRLIDSAS